MPSNATDILPQTALRGLLHELLSEAELRRLLFDAYGHTILALLPIGVSPLEVCFAAVDALDRRGLIGAELFRRMIAHAPRKEARIQEVAARFGLGAPGPDDPRIAFVERLHMYMKAGEALASLEFVTQHAAAFFPSTVADEHGWVTTYTLHVDRPHTSLLVEVLRMRDWASSAVHTTAHVLLGAEVRLLRQDVGRTRHAGWALDDACVAAIDRCLEGAQPQVSPIEFGGRVSIYMGSRAQLDSHAKLAAWSAAKDAYKPRGVLLRTTEGFIDQLASQTLGERWSTLIPPDSPLHRTP